MKQRFVVSAVFFVLWWVLVSVSLGVSSVGVKVGDWFKYAVSVSGSGFGDFGDFFGGLNETEWMKWEVVSVSGLNVTLEFSMRFKNGSDSEVQTFAGDVGRALGNMTLLIPAGLKKGDALPSAMFGSSGAGPVIKDTVTRYYAGANRNVNVFSFKQLSYSLSMEINAYWDQATGVLMELYYSISVQDQNMQMSIRTSETNMWSHDFFADLGNFLWNNRVYVGIVVVVVAVATVVLMVRRRKPVSAGEVQPNIDAVEKPA